MHILFTRPLEDCKEIMVKFQLLGHEVSHMPLIYVEKKKIMMKLILKVLRQ